MPKEVTGCGQALRTRNPVRTALESYAASQARLWTFWAFGMLARLLQMSNPSELDPSPGEAEICPPIHSPKRRRLWRWLIVLFALAGASALWWSSTRPSLTALGVKDIKGYDYLCFVLRYATTKDSNVSVYIERGRQRTRVRFTLVSKNDGGLWKRAEIRIFPDDARMVSGGKPIRVRVQIRPNSRGFTGEVRRWLSAVIPARYLYQDRVLTSEPFVP